MEDQTLLIKENEPTQSDKIALPPPRDPYAVPLWMLIAGPILAVSAAVTTAFVRVRDEFYTKVKHEAGIRDLSKVRYAGKDEIITAFLESRPDGNALKQELDALQKTVNEQVAKLNDTARSGDMQVGELRKGIASIEKSYTQGVNNILQQTGYETKGLAAIFRGTQQRWKHLGRDKRFGINFSALVSAGAAMGLFFILNQNKRLRNELSDIRETVDGAILSSPHHVPEKNTDDDMPRMKVETDGLKHSNERVAEAVQRVDIPNH